jgi:hypothetical protein
MAGVDDGAVAGGAVTAAPAGRTNVDFHNQRLWKSTLAALSAPGSVQ